ncbi:hypothetical protein CDD83_7209 [Cordyceps sp. RAO-2017]|nr:hypothetical protein CDD83_7209 [Cordyceps sp. RAO-2017]
MLPLLFVALFTAAARCHVPPSAFEATLNILGRRQGDLVTTPLEQLSKAAKVANKSYAQAQETAEQAKRYHEKETELFTQTSKASECYTSLNAILKVHPDDGKDTETFKKKKGNCDKEYADCQSLLYQALKIAKGAHLPKERLSNIELPDVRDGGLDIDHLLQNLHQVSKQASKVKAQTEQLPDYRPQLKDLVDSLSKAKDCYQKGGRGSGKAASDGTKSACNDLDTKARAKLEEVRKLAKEPGFPGGDMLSKFNIDEGGDNKTQAADKISDEGKERQTDTVKKDSPEAKKTIADLSEKINKTEIGQIIRDAVVKLEKFVALNNVTNGGTDESAAKAAKEAGIVCLEGILKRTDDIVNKAFGSLSAQ